MRELDHADLFKPPEGTTAVVIPVSAEFWAKPPATYYTPMKTGYAKVALAKWKRLHINIGVLHWRMGATPHPLTGSKDKRRVFFPGKHEGLPPSFHLISFPTRKYVAERMSVEYLCHQLRSLKLLCDGRIPWLKEGTIVLPQFCDGEDRPWAYWQPHVTNWLADDRFLVISGKQGTIT